jgi:VirE N-terminal domain
MKSSVIQLHFRQKRVVIPLNRRFHLNSTGLFDLDDLSDLIDTYEAIQQEPWVLACFETVSGQGLRILVRIPVAADDAEYKRYWHALADYIEQAHNVTVDQACKDIARLSFVSYDPSMYLNENATVFTLPDSSSRQQDSYEL